MVIIVHMAILVIESTSLYMREAANPMLTFILIDFANCNFANSYTTPDEVKID